MTTGEIASAGLPGRVNPLLAKALEWLGREAATAAPGRHEIDGDRLFVNVDEYAPHPFDEVRFELHQKYVDVQCCLEGAELMHVGDPRSMQTVAAHDPAKDVAWLRHGAAGTDVVSLRPGRFAVLWPSSEAHQPGVADPSAPCGRVRKAIAKISLAAYLAAEEEARA
ncbi:MAG: YhcH/YjgK/YiaL family protein [Kiritimatiellae bacterium]|nr:YhcH/YjgK/YiaL family protein [Kiritimatiellia bacterium]